MRAGFDRILDHRLPPNTAENRKVTRYLTSDTFHGEAHRIRASAQVAIADVSGHAQPKGRQEESQHVTQRGKGKCGGEAKQRRVPLHAAQPPLPAGS
ncbi:MAG: hypothetical protein HY820_06895 [Acidobacteria bacterium]|nr:hypothetical protein [Acidobacteriota bacterium]